MIIIAAHNPLICMCNYCVLAFCLKEDVQPWNGFGETTFLHCIVYISLLLGCAGNLGVYLNLFVH